MDSATIHSLYQGSNRDDQVFELTDYPGIQIVRRYPSTYNDLSEKRMFIKFFLENRAGTLVVHGGIDMVKNAAGPSRSGWVIDSQKGGIIQRPSNFAFGSEEGVWFDRSTNEVVIEKHRLSVTPFISVLERNHLRDMFLFSRMGNAIRLFYLRSLFFLVDAHYDAGKYLFRFNDTDTRLHPNGTQTHVPEDADPLFHYFRIFKNLFGVGAAALLIPLFIFSIILPAGYFSISNPFLLFAALLFLYLLEKLGRQITKKLERPGYVRDVTFSTLQMKGKLRLW